MSRLTFVAFKIDIVTNDGNYGFECKFEPGLNIIRGNNSSGKSTLVNSIIYSLGMEEILGGRGVGVLPYALKEYLEDFSKRKVKIVSSYVYIEIKNDNGEDVTLKRAIKSTDKSWKLVEVIRGPYLSKPGERYSVEPKFLHDKGSASSNESGFFSFFEKYLGFVLPNVASSNGGEAKLYLQTLFSAMLIEQKRGWTDYVANTPYYAIRDVKTKISEFLLDFDVFENDKERSLLITEMVELGKRWEEEKFKIQMIEDSSSVRVVGVKKKIDDKFDPNLVSIIKSDGVNEFDLYEYIGGLVKEYECMQKRPFHSGSGASKDLIERFKSEKSRLDEIFVRIESIASEMRLSEVRLKEYRSMLIDIEKDLGKNKIAKKLKDFGASSDIEIASDSCPACHQLIDDSLLLADSLIQPMTIDENIKYLDSQRKMIGKYISGIEKNLSSLASQFKDVSSAASEQRMICISIKKDIKASGDQGEADLRLKIQIENKIDLLNSTVKSLNDIIFSLVSVKDSYVSISKKLASVPDRKSSVEDRAKHHDFQRFFREYADEFGYKSAPTSDIEINRDTLLPYLSGIELREVNTDIKSDSSASDFVRLIWSYLLSLVSTSALHDGNHPGLLLFDEPGQHSMSVSSVNNLLRQFSKKDGFQGVVAASFDESDDVFNESVSGVSYNLIAVKEKLLCKIN